MAKIFHFGGIRDRLILFLLIILVPVLLIEGFIFYRTYETRKSEELRANLEVAYAVAKNFNTFFQDIVHIESVIGQALTTSQPMPDRDRDRILDSIQTDHPAVRSVFWIKPDGLIAASSLRAYVGFDVGDRSFVKEIVAGRDWVVSELILGKATGKWTFTVSRAIRDGQGKLLGIVAASIEPDRLDSVLGIDRSTDAGISLIDNKGMHVYRYPHTEYSEEQRNWLKHYPMIRDSLNGKDVLTSVLSESTDKRRLVAFTPISTIGWVASASRTEDAIFKPIISTLLLQAGMVFLVTLFGFAVAAASAHSISTMIIRLRNHALALGRGERENFALTSGPDELKDLSQALNQMAQEVQLREQQLKEANEELETFSYTVSHDLKAPLRAIDGYFRMLQKKCGGTLDGDALRMMDVIRSNTQMMGTLIDDLLSFSRALRNSMTLSEIDMDRLASEVWNDIRATQPERQLEFKVTNLLPGFGDTTFIRQVLFNLLSNAVKFTKNRVPAIIDMSSYTEPGNVVYCLKDNGVGFDMRYYDKLFNVFQRLHSTNDYEGTGIGLAIVQRIIHRHGGRVWAEGAVDKGATFYFSLPQK